MLDKKNTLPAKELWNQRYQTEGYLFGQQEIHLLQTRGHLLKTGKSLDVAMGEGRNTVYLARNGFQAEGLDCSSIAIEKAQELARDHNVSIESKVQNLDFFLIPLMKYDSILMSYYKPAARFFSEIKRGLVTGGTFALEAYTTEHYRQHSGKYPLLSYEECYSPNEVLKALNGFHIMFYQELPVGESHLVQAIARKV